MQTLDGDAKGNSVLCVAFSPDGRLVAAGRWGNIIELWNRSAWTLRQTLTGHNAPVSTVAFSPDGRLLASGSDDKTIKLWDAVSGTLVKTLAGHEDRVMSVAVQPRRAYCWRPEDADDTIRFGMSRVEPRSRPCAGTQRGCAPSHSARTAAGWLPEATTGPCRIWDLASGREKQVLNGHKYDVESVAFDMTSRSIASGSRDRTVKLWGRTD